MKASSEPPVRARRMAEGKEPTARCSASGVSEFGLSAGGLDGWLGMQLSTDEGFDDRLEPVRR
jgi:hypothetical protein